VESFSLVGIMDILSLASGSWESGRSLVTLSSSFKAVKTFKIYWMNTRLALLGITVPG